MRLCDDLYDNIVFYNNLPETEQEQVDLHIKECQKCHKLWQEFRKIELGLNVMLNHVSDEMLNRYTVFMADPEIPDFDGVHLTKAEVERIESHMSTCALCQQKLTQMQKEYREIAAYFEETDLPDLSLGQAEQPVIVATNPPKTSLLEKLKESFENLMDEIEQKIFAPVPKLVPVGIGAMAAIFAIIWFGPFLRNDNPYFHLTGIEADRVTLPTRGTVSENLSQSLDAFKAGDYGKSIDFLETSLAEENNEDLKATGYYLLGISYLQAAKTDILGRFRKVDQDLVKKAIINLQIAKTAGTNKATREECDWYIAKAYLLQGKVDRAKHVLTELQNAKGRRFFDAKALIQEIDGIIQIE